MKRSILPAGRELFLICSVRSTTCTLRPLRCPSRVHQASRKSKPHSLQRREKLHLAHGSPRIALRVVRHISEDSGTNTPDLSRGEALRIRETNWSWATAKEPDL